MWSTMNPAVYSDPQVIPQLVPPCGRGRPTLYSPELIEEFCGLIVDGMTIDRACKEAGMPSRRTIKYWLTKYPEFRREFEAAIAFRNQCWMDDCVDIADGPQPKDSGDRNVRINARLIPLKGMGLKAAGKPGDGARLIGTSKQDLIEHDPIFGKMYEWELAVQRPRSK
jgi:Bacteriophage Sf6, terminase small subunit-like